MDPRLLSAISKPKIQSQAGELVRLALRALDDLKQLDEGLYERFVATRVAPPDRAASEAGLRKLWDQTFRGMTPLLSYCKTLAATKPRPPTADPSAPGAAADPNDAFGGVDWGDLEGGGGGDGAAALAEGSGMLDLDLGSSDIGDLLDGIDEHVEEGDSERWAKVIETVGSIEYGLRTQLADATARVDVALGAGELGHVLGLLDDTQSATSEGVHALVSAVYQTFLPDINPASVVPGYLTSLARALLVRRGLAELTANLGPRNEILQADTPAQHAAALAGVKQSLREFVSSVVCRAMRPADRWQLVELERELAEQPLSVARLTSEGIVKYLDSLSSINQREVLLIHDRRAIDDMRESLANARELVDISPRTAAQMMDRAHEAAQKLLGRSPTTDQLVGELEWYVPASGARVDVVAFLERLEAVLVATDH